MKPVPLLPTAPQGDLTAWTANVQRVMNQLITYWNQGIDANVMRPDAIATSSINWPLLAPYGTVNAPSYSWILSPKTGFYGIGLNNVGFAINGTKLLDLSSATLALTGAQTISTTLNVTGNVTFAADIIMTAALSRILPGATSFTIRNNADSASNLVVSNAGAVTVRDVLTVSGSGGSTVTGSLGIGVAAYSDAVLRLSGTHPGSAVTSYGLYMTSTAPSTATTLASFAQIEGNLANVAVTYADVRGVNIATIAKGGSVVAFTNLYGLYINAMTAGATNYALFTNAGIVKLGDTTDATSITSGGLQTLGGVGITKALWVGGIVNIAGATVTVANGTTINWASSADRINGSTGTSFTFDLSSTTQFTIGTAGCTVAGTLTVSGASLTMAAGLLAITGTGVHTIYASSSANLALDIRNTNATNPYGIDIGFTGAAPNDATRYFLTMYDNAAGGTVRARFYSNGGLANYQANNVDLSDATLKNLHADPHSQWDDWKKLKFVTFAYKDDPKRVNIGLTAQQVQTVYPELVEEFSQNKLGIREQQIMMRAGMVIQELQTRIERLEEVI